jgi:uncharacterized protein YjbI with pentapeptide repeats
MLGRRRGEAAPSGSTGAGGFAAKADDLESLRGAVVDAASVGTGLWLSYLFALFYFAVAAGAVTHRNLLLEDPVKLPFLNVELPLTAFFILAPLVFLIVHGYVLLHLVMLAGKTGAFDKALSDQIADDNRRTRLRRQLPSNVFVQFLAGPPEVRRGIVGILLKAVAWISLVFAPIALLALFQLQFLPYHDRVITGWHRIAVVIDLVLLWLLLPRLLWPPILRGETRFLAWRDFGRVRVLAGVALNLVLLFLVFTIATFPGEWLNEHVPSVAWVPTRWPGLPAGSSRAEPAEAERALAAGSPAQAPTIGQSAIDGWRRVRQNVTDVWSSMGPTSLYRLLVGGDVDFVEQRPQSVWSNILVLPNLDLSDRTKANAKLSFRGRHLEKAILVGAVMEKADFTGAELAGANLSGANLRQAKFDCDEEGGKDKGGDEKWKCSNLQGALLVGAQLQGASLDGAQLQGALLVGAQLQGASLDEAELQGALLDRAQLQGAWLDGAELQGASLDQAQLQGAWLDRAELQDASLGNVFVWRMVAPERRSVEHARIASPVHDAKYFDIQCKEREYRCEWTKEYYEALKAKIEAVPAGQLREEALQRIKPLGRRPFAVDENVAKRRQVLRETSKAEVKAYPARLAEILIKTGCDGRGVPYVIRGLTRQLDDRFASGDPNKAAVANAFLAPGCEGARGLSDDDKATLRRLAAPAPKQSAGAAPGRRAERR